MAMIPLKQEVKVTRPAEDDGGWGSSGKGKEFTLAARVDEKTQTIENQFGDEVVTSAEIILDGLADIKYEDNIFYEDELGRTVNQKPALIEPIRMVSGKPVMTVVYVNVNQSQR